MAQTVMTLREAVSKYVHDGDTVAIEGFTHLIPFAGGHEIIRQGRRDLTLVRMTPDIVADQLVAAGCIKKMVFAFTGNSSVGSLYAIRRSVEQSSNGIELEEYSHYGMLCRYQAGASGLPFMPIRSYAGGDLPRVNANLKKVASPFDADVETYVVPPVNPDVAIIHAQRADRRGNVQAWGILGPQQEAAFASRRVIALVEEIVDDDVVTSDPNRTTIPSFVVDAVCEVPFGAHPAFAQGYYDRDNEFYRRWSSISKDEQALAAWLDEWVYQLDSHEEYLEKLGADYFDQLKPTPHMSQPVNYGSAR